MSNPLWNLMQPEDKRTPRQVLERYAKNLTEASGGDLIGVVLDHQYEDSRGVMRFYHTLQIVLKKTNLPYKFIEVEPLLDENHKIGLKFYLLTQTEHVDNIRNVDQLDVEIHKRTQASLTGHLLKYLRDMDNLKIKS